MVEDALYLPGGLFKRNVEAATTTMQGSENNLIAGHKGGFLAQLFEFLFISVNKITLFLFS